MHRRKHAEKQTGGMNAAEQTNQPRSLSAYVPQRRPARADGPQACVGPTAAVRGTSCYDVRVCVRVR